MRSADLVFHLKSMPLFARLGVAEVTRLASRVRELRVPRGTHVVEEGAHDACFYLIVDGEAHAMRGDSLLTVLHPGDVFGEITVFDGSARSATVVAGSPLHLLRLERPDLLRAIEEFPRIGIGLCQALSRRVRELEERVAGEATPDEGAAG